MARPALTVYGRAWCHLCDDLRAELAPIATEFGVAINVIDIDSDPALEAVYNELVPVLMFEGAELSRYRLDAARVREALNTYAPERGSNHSNGG